MEKKIFISADIEGITDVTTWAETEVGGNGYEDACAQMTREVSAACEAVLEAGYVPVVRDGHETATNIRHIDLPDGTELMRGWACHPGSMLAGVDGSYSGVFYIGYHAPGGSNGSPLAHTIDREKIRWVKINGKLASEFTINSLYAASKGVPSLLITGDEMICRMAKEEVPQMAAVAVKHGRGNSTHNLHPLEACRRIKEAAARQLEQFAKAPYGPQPVPEALVMELCLGSHQAVRSALHLPGVEKVDEFTVRCTAKDPTEFNIVREQIHH